MIRLREADGEGGSGVERKAPEKTGAVQKLPQSGGFAALEFCSMPERWALSVIYLI
jgi:hypothetical protein